MFKPTFSRFLATIVMAVITAAFAMQAFGQIDPPSTASVNPHDFSDKYYVANSMNPKDLTGRLTGKDFLSTISPSDDPMFSDVRVLITLPAYKQDGQPVFWSPLGTITFNDPSQETGGLQDLAAHYPIYVFPAINPVNQSSFFTGTRQAPLMDDSAASSSDANPLALRQVLVVNYNSNATTRWGARILRVMAKENGSALDGGPIVKSMEDLKTLINYSLVTITTGVNGDAVAVCPVIQDPKNGAIAKDAFVSVTTNPDGKPLEAERIFINMFTCYQDSNSCSGN